MQDFGTLRKPLLGELAMSQKRRRREEENKMPFIVATYVYACSPRAAHALRLDQCMNTVKNCDYLNTWTVLDLNLFVKIPDKLDVKNFHITLPID